MAQRHGLRAAEVVDPVLHVRKASKLMRAAARLRLQTRQ
jgi:hypothetical protein